jgi:hypothetical protein
MDGAPVAGLGYATLTGADFKIPAAAAASGTTWGKQGMFRTTTGSFTNVPPYLYSYSYATLRNDAGEFGAGKGFFATNAVTNMVNFQNKLGNDTVASANVTKGSNSFGGVMRLLGQLTTKVCYFYQGGCGLGYGQWNYESIGDAGFKNKAGTVVTKSYTDNTFTFQYYNTALNTKAKYTVVPQRFPWTTGTVTVTATGRGPHDTFHQRKGFDNRRGRHAVPDHVGERAGTGRGLRSDRRTLASRRGLSPSPLEARTRPLPNGNSAIPRRDSSTYQQDPRASARGSSR